MPSDDYKWFSLGAPIRDHPNATYSYPDRTRFNADTGTYRAHPSYANDRAARDRKSMHGLDKRWATGSNDTVNARA
ncbi:uncharacterized protein PV07_10979 [Cladophialophora immunda]|uniref:Uncharacterized protein n=1 Tax=Cladophialophora immunda TaxID=569365 RepID=A0A0D2ACX6_9EURO|nr:uncharacterized protein PV07_10979 [Cladophialophora immunda]KIW22712.1 hypothetical protein PV07_10979 [Cladophialophora immunda]